jgi:hypothetical protein
MKCTECLLLLTWLYNSRVEAACGILNCLPLQIKALIFIDATFGKNVLLSWSYASPQIVQVLFPTFWKHDLLFREQTFTSHLV